MAAVMHDWDFNLDTSYLNEGLDLYESLNLEEFWKTDLESLTEEWNFPDDTCNFDCKRGATMIRVHDCMWAGTCLSEDHVGRKRNENKINTSKSLSNSTTSNCCTSSSSCSTRTGSSPVRIASSSNKQTTPTTVSSTPRTVLRKTSLPTPVKVLPRPDTPPSEDELSKTPDDQELWWKGVSLTEITGQRRRDATNFTAVTAPAVANSVSFDHNYNSKEQPKMEDVGLDTPSDSEEEEVESEEEEESQSSEVDDEDEEIDVVSCQPPSPPRRKQDKRLGDDWKRMERAGIEEVRRREKLRMEQEWKMELMRQEAAAVKYATQAKRTMSENKGRGRQKRKRTTSDEDETYRSSYKVHGYRKTTGVRPRTVVRRKYTGTTPSKKTRIPTDSETDTTEKRSQHNNMERMRRIDLRNAFDELRGLIPSLTDTNRAAKVTILRDAASYCQQLTSNSKTLVSQVQILRREQEKLRSNLSKLRRHIANKHIGSAHR